MRNDVVKVGNVYNPNFTGGSYAGNVYLSSGLSPAINCMGGGGRMPMVIVWTKCDGGNI